MRRQFSLLLIVSLALLFGRCAQITPLTGGERDQAPPVLREASPLSGATSFTATEILLRFDENVQLTDLAGQFIVSPRMDLAPEVTAEGKMIRIRLNRKSLRPNTTYRLDFGKSVADMNESNRMDGLSYVFATGTVIDTLKLSGSVITASNNLPAGDILVGLYGISDTLTAGETDSLPFLTTPLYMARTGSGGSFLFTNLPSASFAAFAIGDVNRNALYDAGAERVGFRKEPLRPGADSSVTFRIFTEQQARQFVRRAFSAAPGVVTVVYNRRADYKVTTLDPDQRNLIFELQPGVTKDTISLLYRGKADTLSLRIEQEATGKTDTVRIAMPLVRAGAKKRLHPLTLVGARERFDPARPLLLRFRQWMDTTKIRADRLHLRSDDDSLIGRRSWRLSWYDVQTLALVGDWHRGSAYDVRIDTGLAVGTDGVVSDSALLSFRISGPEDVSKLTINLVVQKKQAYLAQLLGQGEKVIETRVFAVPLSSPNRIPLVFDGLTPGSYKLKVVFDDNANGRWDTGDVVGRIQPERVFIEAKEFKLLGDWEVEEEVQLKNEHAE